MGLIDGVAAVAKSAFGTVSRPVRSSASLLLNDPGGWVANQPGPWPWDADVPSRPVWWVGESRETGGPIGPHGPWTQGGGLPASVERATGVIVGPLVTLPWRLYRGSWRDDSAAEPMPPRLWMADPMLCGNVPGPGGAVFPIQLRRPAASVWGSWLRHALWFGRGYVTFTETGDPQSGDPFAEPVAGTVLNLAPNMVEERDDGGWRIGDDDNGVNVDPDGRYRLGGRTWRLLALWEPIGDGAGVFGRHARDLGLAVHVRNYASSTFRSGIPNGYLKVTQGQPSQAQVDQLKERWLEAHGGDERSIAVLNASVDFQAITVKPIDAQLTGVDDMVLRIVAHAFTLSGRTLDSGAAASNSYANIQDERHDRVDDSVMPWKRTLEDTLTSLLPFGTWHEVDLRGYLETDTTKRTAYYQAMTGMGAMTVDEVRRLERLSPLPELPPESEPEPEEVPDADA